MSNTSFVGETIKVAASGGLYGAAAGCFGGAAVYALGEISAKAVVKTSASTWLLSLVSLIDVDGSRINPQDRWRILETFTCLGAGLGAAANLSNYFICHVVDLVDAKVQQVISTTKEFFWGQNV